MRGAGTFAVLLAVALAGAFVGSSLAASSSAPALSKEGVSALGYAPRPFHADRSRMRVTFTTTGRARPGRQYVVELQVPAPRGQVGRCTDYAPSTRKYTLRIVEGVGGVGRPRLILGAPGKTYSVVLIAYPGQRFCRGPARLSVLTAPVRGARPGGSRALRTVRFRILPAS